MATENRVHPRLVVRLSVDYRPSGTIEWHQGTIHDLSASGVSLLTPVRLKPEALISLRFNLRGVDSGEATKPIEVETLVVRASRESQFGGNVRFRAACHFLNLPGPPYDVVRRYVFDRTKGSRSVSY